MAEVVLRLPSKVPYGYVEIRADASEVESLPSPDMLASFYAAYFLAYKESEVGILEAGPSTAKSKAAQIQVSDILAEMSDGDRDDREAAAKTLIVRELGGIPVEETGDEPWNQPPATTKEKPWIAEPDWDFG
ncbi:MAG TPA: hypothetical protein VIY48_13405 [Candidatus Paceibacterota bacterium]